MEDNLLIAIGRLEGKVDALISALKSHSSAIDEHDERIRSLEQGRAWLLGAAAILGGGCSFLIKLIGG
jgi:hypothetical protein